MTLVACIGGGQLGADARACRAAARAPLPLSRPLAGRVRGRGRRARGRGVRRRRCARPPRGRRGCRDVRVRERAGGGRARGSAPCPGCRALEEGQDRLREKELFRSLGIPTARFGTLADTGLPALVKSRRLGYDGKGQRRLDVAGAIDDGEIAEELVAFDRELSIMGVRGGDRRDALLAGRRERPPRRDPARRRARPLSTRRRPRPRRSARRSSTRSTTSACSPSSSSRWAVGSSPTSSRRVSTTRRTGRSTAPRRASSRTTCGRSSACRSARPARVLRASWSTSSEPRRRSRSCSLSPASRVHLYGKAPRAGRKVGHVTLLDPVEETVERLTALADEASGAA